LQWRLVILIYFISKILIDLTLFIGGDDSLGYRPIYIVWKYPGCLAPPPGTFRLGIYLIIPNYLIIPPTALSQILQTIPSYIQFCHNIRNPDHFRMTRSFEVQLLASLIENEIYSNIRGAYGRCLSA